MRVILTLCALLLLAACRGAAPLPARALEHNEAGVEALKSGNLDEADTHFRLALEYSPKFVEALTNQGLVEVQRGNFERARQLIERARRLNTDVAQPHHALGVLAEHELMPNLAAKHYRAALAVDPGFVPSRNNLGRLLFGTGRIEHAREEFAAAVAAAPDDLASLTGLVECLLRLNRLAEADSTLDRVLVLHAGTPRVDLLLARRLLRHGDPDAAVAVLAPLTARQDDVAVAALGWMGVAELCRGRPRHAVGAGRAALELAPNDSLATWVVATGFDWLDDGPSADWRARASVVSPR